MDSGLGTSASNQLNVRSAQQSSNTIKYIFITVSVSLVIALLTGIGIYLWQQSQINTLKLQMQSEVNKLKQNITTIEEEKDALKKQVESEISISSQKALKAEEEKKDIEQKTCKGVWKNGICVQSKCVDSDVNEKPNDIYIKGNVTYTDENGVSTTVYDECSGSKQQVNEMWCYESPTGSGNYVQGRMVYNCSSGCLDGACIK